MYTILSIPIIILSFTLFKMSAGRLSLLTINMHSLIFYYQIVLLCFIGVNIASLNLDNHYALSSITDLEIRKKAYISVGYVMLMMPLSMIMTNIIFKFKPKKVWDDYVKRPVKSAVTSADKPVYILLVLLVVVNVIAVGYSVFKIGTLPMIEAFLGNDNLDQLRIESSRGFSGNPFIKNLLGINLSLIISYIAYTYKLLYKSKKWNRLFIITVILAVITQTLTTAKAPLLIYLLGFLLIKVLIDGRIKKKHFIFFIIFIITIIFAFYSMLGFNTVLSINDGPVGRMLLGQITPLYYYFQIFPDVHPYLGLLSESDYSAGRIVMSIFSPGGVEQGTSGVMNSLFIAEAYAHFGIYGIIFSPIIVGVIVQIFFIGFLRNPKNPITIAVYVFVVLKLQGSITGGFWAFIYNPNIIFIFIVIILLLFGSNILKRIALKEGPKRS